MDHPVVRLFPSANRLRLACALFLLVTLALIAADLLDDAQHRETDAIDRIAQSSLQLDLQIGNLLRETDLTFDDLAANPLIDTALRTHATRTGEALQAALDAPLRHIPFLTRISLVDRDCRVLASSQGETAVQPLNEGLCFWLHGRGRRSEHYFTGTDFGQKGGLIHAYRLYDAQRAPSGMLVAQLSGARLAVLMSEIAAGQPIELFIRDRHQMAAAAWPRAQRAAGDGATRSIRRLEDRHQIYDATSPDDKSTHLYSERKLDNFPLSVTAGINRRALRDATLAQVASHFAAWLALAAVAYAVLRRLLRQGRHSARLRNQARRLFDDRAHLLALLEILPLALLLVEPVNARIHMANKRARDLLQWAGDDELQSMTDGARAPVLDLAPISQWLAQGLWTEAREVDLERPGQAPLRVMATLAPSALGEETLCMVALQERSDRQQLEDALSEARHCIRQLESSDGLTRLANRKTALQALERETRRCQRYGHPMCVATLDIDHFAAFNERYGREAGDNVLIAVANTLLDCTRGTDLCARIDGEEFLLLLTNTPLKYALQVMDRIRDRLAETVFPLAEQRVTFSGGLTCWQPDDSADRLLQRMNALVERARADGRNQYCCDETGPLA